MKFPSFPMRVAFYCGVLTSGWPFGILLILQNNIFVEIVEALLAIYLPFGLLLLVPGIQESSRERAIKTLWLGPVLLIADFFLSAPFTLDNRNLTNLPFIVPGNLGAMNPGASIEFLILNFAIFVALITTVLGRTYWNTRILGCPYTVRVLFGGITLLLILHFEIQLTSVTWSSSNMPFEPPRLDWIIASMSWLLLSGFYWAFVLGVTPKVLPQQVRSQVQLGNEEARCLTPSGDRSVTPPG